MILNTSIDEIRNKSDIVKTISEYVPLKQRGKNYLGLCPFHSEKTPSFTVSPDKGIWHCFGCGEGGNLFAFLMKSENISFAESIEMMGEKLGIEVKKKDDGGRSNEKDKYLEIMNLAINFYRSQLNDNGKPALDYIAERDISKEVVDKFKLSYAPNRWEALYEFLYKKGVSQQDMMKVGLILERKDGSGFYDRFRNRLMFPIFNMRNKAIGFSGRTLTKDEQAKYVNSPDSPIYNKGLTLYGINITKEFIKKEGFAVLVEGNIDLLTCYQFGVRNVVAPLGTAFTHNQAKLLSRFTNHVIIVFDKDSAGTTATARSANILRECNINVFITNLSGGKDPDAALRKGGVEKFIDDLKKAQPWVEYELKNILRKHNLKLIEDKSKAIKEAASILANEKDSIALKEYIKLLNKETGIDSNTIEAEIKQQTYYLKKPKVSSAAKITEKPNSKLTTAEETLIKLALDDPKLLTLFKEKLHWGEFTLPANKVITEIMQSIEIENGTNLANLIMNNLPTDESKKAFTKVSVGELPAGNKEQMFHDCINTIKAHHLKTQLDSIRVEINTAEKENDIGKVTELHKKFNEYTKLYRTLEKVI